MNWTTCSMCMCSTLKHRLETTTHPSPIGAARAANQIEASQPRYCANSQTSRFEKKWHCCCCYWRLSITTHLHQPTAGHATATATATSPSPTSHGRSTHSHRPSGGARPSCNVSGSSEAARQRSCTAAAAGCSLTPPRWDVAGLGREGGRREEELSLSVCCVMV